MSPAYFGMVMATGIVSLGAHFMAMPRIADALFLLNIVVYVALCVLTAVRMVCHTRAFFSDMLDHLRGPGFFTTVAATGILGNQFIVLSADYRAGIVLWGVAVILWIGLTYTIFTGFTVKEHKPTLDKGINGAWLLAVVATQAIAALGALLAAHVDQPGKLMGAMAISTLAGSLLIVNVSDAPFLTSLLPFIKGFTVFYWATGTWWIPMLLVLATWRHVYKRFPMKYDPLYWGAVFPLGMYAVSTDRMIEAMGFDFLGFLPPIFLYIALAAWTAAFIGFVRDLLRRIRTFKSREPVNPLG